MNTKLVSSLGAAIIITLLSTGASASRNNEAVTACKSHVQELYKGDLRSKLKKTKNRRNVTEVIMKISTGDKRFIGTCKVDSDGKLEYSTNE